MGNDDEPISASALIGTGIVSNSTVGVPELAIRTRVSEDDVRAIFDAIVGFLGDGTNVNIPKFGKFTSVYMPPRKYRSNIAEGISKPKIIVRFRISKVVKAAWMERLRKLKGQSGETQSHYTMTESGKQGLVEGQKKWREYHESKRGDAPAMIRQEVESTSPIVVETPKALREGVRRRKKDE